MSIVSMCVLYLVILAASLGKSGHVATVKRRITPHIRVYIIHVFVIIHVICLVIHVVFI